LKKENARNCAVAAYKLETFVRLFATDGVMVKANRFRQQNIK
jgi:hypothetical protein